MKALIINGSPRGQRSNSKIMSDFFEQGLKSAGVTTESVFLAELKLEYCRGCFGCWTSSPGKCVIEDGLNELLLKYTQADYIIFAAPVYYYTMPAVMKNFIDRLLPLATPQIHKDENGEFYHQTRHGKLPKTVLLTNCGFPGEGNFSGIKVAFTFLNPLAVICRNQGEILKVRQSPVKEIVEKYGELLKQAALEIVQTGTVSAELDKLLTTSLIPDEVYMQGANQNWG